jgi:hypothetical protein
MINDNSSELENGRIPQEKSPLFLLYPPRNGICCTDYCTLRQPLGYGNIHFEGLSYLHMTDSMSGLPSG